MPIFLFPMRSPVMIRSTIISTTTQTRTLYFCGPKSSVRRSQPDLPHHYLAGPSFKRGSYIIGESIAKTTITTPKESNAASSETGKVTKYVNRLEKRENMNLTVWDETGKKGGEGRGG
jgi:hypothetical protein